MPKARRLANEQKEIGVVTRSANTTNFRAEYTCVPRVQKKNFIAALEEIMLFG